MPFDDSVAFAERLKLALTRSHKKIETATELALQFNLRHGHGAITQQAAQKWLNGQAKPKADKIKTLAQWLNVSTHWLMYGDREASSAPATVREDTSQEYSTPSPQDAAQVAHLSRQFHKLSTFQRQLIINLVDQLVLGKDAWSQS